MGEQALRKGDKLVVASHNPGKVFEIRSLIYPFGLEAVSAKELNLEEPEETGATFEANAALKALAAAKVSGFPALADDSGLEVDALDGAPGIYSARWAGEPRDFGVAMEKVQQELLAKGAHAPDRRRANFICALCLAFPDGATQTFVGRVFGELVWPPRGDKGFGYDPMFQPDGLNETFAEIDPVQKQDMSHRAKAFDLFEKECLEQLGS